MIATAGPPQFTSVSVSGADVILTGTNGAAGGGLSIWSSTNLSLPTADWTLVATPGQFDTTGSFSFTNTGAAARRFCRNFIGSGIP